MPREQQILSILKKEYPDSKTALDYKKPIDILVATILSAQCTDKRVNIVTKNLFRKYRTAGDYAKADIKKFEQEIRSTGFYRNKAKNIIAAAKKIVDEHAGKVPDTMEDLIKLPGVARKTANIVMWNAYSKIGGIAVDTHVTRVSFRLGLTKNTNPIKIEQDLMNLYPKQEWPHITNFIIAHGRAVCKAPTPICSRCVLNRICPKNGVKKQL